MNFDILNRVKAWLTMWQTVRR